MACQVKMGYLGHLDHQVTKGAEESKDMLGHKVRNEHDFGGEMCEMMQGLSFLSAPPVPTWIHPPLAWDSMTPLAPSQFKH